MIEPPSAEEQLAFLFRIQRLLTEGVFESTYKFALLLSLAELAIERGDDTTERVEVDHFIAWSRYPLDLGHNFVLADTSCNGDKCDRLPAMTHLERWARRNAEDTLAVEFDAAGLPHDKAATTRVADWAYAQADRAKAQLWVTGRDGLEPLPPDWRARVGWPSTPPDA